MRVAVASIVQETNTFSPLPSTLEDFTAQGLWTGDRAVELSRGSNTEFAGAVSELQAAGATVVPLLRAWAMSGGVLQDPAFGRLRDMLLDGLRGAGPVDGVVLSLHGALVAESDPAADAALTEAVRRVLGPDPLLIVTHDLHANLTGRVVAAADAIVGYLTYPHVDQADTGRRGATLLLEAAARGARPVTVLAKRAMLVPAEAQALADPPMAGLRRIADAELQEGIVDVSLFPVQPWLDVPELGFGVTVTTWGDPAVAQVAADRVADAAWRGRAGFAAAVHDLAEVVACLRPQPSGGPVLLVQSADSPTAGATADSAVVIAALLAGPPGIRSYATLVDRPMVDACHLVGVGVQVSGTIGASLDDRWSTPVPIAGRVRAIGDTPVVLAGDSMTGQEISMGRWATLDTAPDGAPGLTVLVTERPAPTFDPAGYRHAGLEPRDADAVLVRSATMYRAGFRGISSVAYVLDLPGASTPRLDYLDFRQAPRPLYPVDLDPADERAVR